MKRILAMILALCMIFALCACGTAAPAAPAETAAPSEPTESTEPAESAEEPAPVEEAAPAEEDPYADCPELNILCVSAMEPATASVQAVEYMKTRLEEETNGKVTMTILPSGQTGGEAEQTEALIVGEADMMICGTMPITTYAPEFGFMDCPFVFEGAEHMFNVWNGDVGNRLRDALEAKNIHSLGMMGRGYRHISTNKPLASLEDMAGLVIRTPQGATFVDTFTALGCVSVPVALTELFTALQTGVCEASEGPWDQLVNNKLYEVQKYIVETKYYYATSLLYMNAEYYAALPEAYKTLINDISAEAMDYGTNLSKEMEEPLKQQVLDYGTEILAIEDMGPFMEATKDTIAKFYAETWTVTSPEEIASYK